MRFVLNYEKIKNIFVKEKNNFIEKINFKILMSFLFFLCLFSLSLISCLLTRMPNELGDDIFYIGLNSYHPPYLEDGNYLRNGLSFNSYIIKDKKSIIIESMYDYHKKDWLELIEKTLNNPPDFLLIQHFEPDNVESIVELGKKYPVRLFCYLNF